MLMVSLYDLLKGRKIINVHDERSTTDFHTVKITLENDIRIIIKNGHIQGIDWVDVMQSEKESKDECR